MTVSDAIHAIDKALNRKFWASRAAEMLLTLTRSSDTPTNIDNLEVSPDWPTCGDIRFTRTADGHCFRLFLDGTRFRGVRVA